MAETDEIRYFDKTLYEDEPQARERVHKVLEKLAELGPAVVAVRGPNFSANLLGVVYVGEDGGDPVIRVRGCDCHVHMMWHNIRDFRLARGDVGYGPEPLVYLTDETGEPVVNLFFPEKSYEEVQTTLNS